MYQSTSIFICPSGYSVASFAENALAPYDAEEVVEELQGEVVAMCRRESVTIAAMVARLVTLPRLHVATLS